jgi:phage terminase large subunit-like protein
MVWNALPPDKWKPRLWSLFRFEPHEAQSSLLLSPARFRVAACGRRFGKSFAAASDAIVYALMGARVWVVAPTYDLTTPITNALMELILRFPTPYIRVAKRSPPQRYESITGGVIETRTAENPDNLQGRALDLLIVDEAATITDPQIWKQYLRPMLIDRKGHAVFISTPKRMNWFYDMFMAGMEHNPYFASFRFPSYANPYLPPGEIESLKQDMSEDDIRQEIEAEFLPDGGTVFRTFHLNLRAKWQTEPIAGHLYVMGVDIAKYEDWTVISVLDTTTREVCYIERFQRINWEVQAERIVSVYRRFQPARVAIDATGNDHMADTLTLRGLPILRVVFTPLTKLTLVSTLAMALEYDDLLLPDLPELRHEFARFTYERTSTGRLRVTAPEGVHDDIVMSIALAVHAALPYWLAPNARPFVVGERDIPNLQNLLPRTR